MSARRTDPLEYLADVVRAAHPEQGESVVEVAAAMVRAGLIRLKHAQALVEVLDQRLLMGGIFGAGGGDV